MNVGALFYLMSTDLGTDVTGLGILSSAFYLGVGTMQIPGGILAAKQGPKKTVTIGILISSLAVLTISISTSLPEVTILRFIVGAGMALVFAPSVVLAAKFLGGKSGIGVGVINSAFSLGGLLGLFGWILIATITGWRPSLILSGTLGLLTALLVIIFVPRDQDNNQFTLSNQKLASILRNRTLLVLGLGALATNLGSVLISSFMVYYLHTELGEPPELAGLVTSMVVVLPILTSLWGGRLYDQSKKPRRIMIIAGLGMVASLVISSIPNTLIAFIGPILAGISAGPAFTIAFAAARDLTGFEKEYESLTIGWVNCISLTGSVWPPLVFSFLADSLNYSVAWLGGAVMSLAFVATVFFLFRTRSKMRSKSPRLRLVVPSEV